MTVRKADYWKNYSTSVLKRMVENYEIKTRIYQGEDLRISLVGFEIRNKSEYLIVKKILEGSL